MEPVRSTTTTTSRGIVGDAPHSPLQAAAVSVPVLPLVMPIAPPKPYWRVASSVTWMVLQTSVDVVAGSQGAQQELSSQSHAVEVCDWLTLHAPGMSVTRGSPVDVMPMRHRNVTVGVRPGMLDCV